MPRKKEFDESEVLHRALQIFWHKGYEGTSIQDLVEQMGINRGSLYGTFSDKRALFLAVIQHYDQTVVSTVVAEFREARSARGVIEEYLRNAADRAVADREQRGDFLTNSAVEVAPHDPEAEKCLQASLYRIESAFFDALVQARALGEIQTRRDLRDLALFLTSTLQGIRVIARVNPDRRALQAIVDIALASLDND